MLSISPHPVAPPRRIRPPLKALTKISAPRPPAYAPTPTTRPSSTTLAESSSSLEPTLEASKLTTKPPKNTPFRLNQSSSSESLPGAGSSKTPATKAKRKPTRTRSSSNEFGVFTPAQVPGAPLPGGSSIFLARKSVSSPLLSGLAQQSPPPYSMHAHEPPYVAGASSSTSNSSSRSQTPSRLHSRSQSRPHSQLPSPLNSDTEDDRDGDDMIYTSRSASSSAWRGTPSSSSGHRLTAPSSRHGSSHSLRSRLFGLAAGNGSSRAKEKEREDKMICTTPGVVCAGETETETDEPSRHLPTARIIQSSGHLVPPNTLQQRLTPLLFEFSRLLAIVPAVFGTLYNLYHIYHPPIRETGVGRPPPERIDFFVAALWSILTGYQCLALTTGLLTRWRLYYPPLSTLVRLLALQGICWPATQLTLTILEHETRPVVTWAVIGTTTCMSRSVQIWVTSNLWWERRGAGGVGEAEDNAAGGPVNGAGGDTAKSNGVASSTSSSMTNLVGHITPATAATTAASTAKNRRGYWRRWGGAGGGKWGGRRWDWREVLVKCVLPAGVVYFVMAWAEQLRREWDMC